MQIAITSGKGGVGKTFVAASLAKVFSQSRRVSLIDCDVEAPNASLFFRQQSLDQTPYMLNCVESIDAAKCNFCGDCSTACYYNAIAVSKRSAVVFSELCRWCGVCLNTCKQGAIVTGQRKIGDIYRSSCGNIDLSWAALMPGAGGMTARLIRKVKSFASELTVFDSPPGTSCAAVASIEQADVVVLVSDATNFGFHDLTLSYRLCCSLGIKPFVIVNRAGLGDIERLRAWCRNQNIEIIAEIPDDLYIAQLYSEGILALDYSGQIRIVFEKAAARLLDCTSRDGYKTKIQNNENLFLSPVTGDSPHQDAGKNTVMPKELAVISGKGGTGKTSLAACFAQLAGQGVIDCDVDAADMHLLLSPKVIFCREFEGGRVMNISTTKCIGCGRCIPQCTFEAIHRRESDMLVEIDAGRCEGCGNCIAVCPSAAIETNNTLDGRWYHSNTRFGKMTHATLIPGAENSGRLVSLLRRRAAGYAEQGNDVLILDGSPGTGCPVIASITGAKAAIIVTEPTLSGLADMRRVLDLTNHFRIPAGVIINKYDINESVTEKICRCAVEKKAVILGRLRYNKIFVDAQQHGKTVLEYDPDSILSAQIKDIWKSILILSGNKDFYE